MENNNTSLRLIYNGKDIYKDVSISKCVIHDRAGGMADNLEIVFSDVNKYWDKWKPQKGDTIQIKTGTYDTGKMYVDDITPQSGFFTINAISIPINSKDKRTRIWRDVKLLTIASDCALKLGLNLKTYGITDFNYKSISQIRETELEFLTRICLREGYSVKICDGNLIIFNEKEMEKAVSDVKIKPEDVLTGYVFNTSNNTLRALTVAFQPCRGDSIRATATDFSIGGGTDRINEFLTSKNEAERWSKGYLRQRNKNYKTAYVPMKYHTNLAAASVVNFEGFGSSDGVYFIDRMTINILNQRTIIEAHKVIEGGY